MTDRVNHAAEALRSLQGAGDGRNFATDASAAAQVHATLALVEQQRIANLIALFQMEGGPYKVTNEFSVDGVKVNALLVKEIREGLGVL